MAACIETFPLPKRDSYGKHRCTRSHSRETPCRPPLAFARPPSRSPPVSLQHRAQAAPNLVVNGGFETTTNGTGEIVPGQTTGQYITSATGWYSTSTTANGGDPFLFIANNAVTAGFGDKWDNGIRYLWGASNGGASTWDGTSASGGNYLVMDGDYHATPISQMLSGLVTGQTYALSYSGPPPSSTTTPAPPPRP